MLFAKAKRPTPVLNTPDFSAVFTYPLPLCEQGLLRPVEPIALPNTPFQIIKQISTQIYQVTTSVYPSDSLFVDGRFLTFSKESSPEPKRHLPSTKTLLNILYSRVGLPYIWGGGTGAMVSLNCSSTTLRRKDSLKSHLQNYGSTDFGAILRRFVV